MDWTVVLIAILALNIGVFLGGCLLAAYRTWGPGRGRDGHAAGGDSQS